ncbi:MAG TPA: lytic transglycosylase domain-containing protein [Methylocystis sp.]|nr:lytic transglycosylase domain-containing protein [Methylocystis sp.]
MKRICGAVAPFLLALSGCSSTTQPDFVATAPDAAPVATTAREKLDLRIAEQAKAQNVPESLIHAIVKRESNYNPSLKHGPYWGLMQIRHDTARSMGYQGPASGLLDPETNMTYAVAYLANAYRVARGDERRAVKLYAGGYYYEAKRKGLLGELRPAPETLRVASE